LHVGIKVGDLIKRKVENSWNVYDISENEKHGIGLVVDVNINTVYRILMVYYSKTQTFGTLATRFAEKINESR